MRGDDALSLVGQSILGSEKAFRRLVESHQPLVYSAVRAVMGNHADLEDTVQEVFIKMYRKLPTFRGESQFSTWLYRIAKNTALSAASAQRHELRPVDEAHDLGSVKGNPDEVHRRELIARRIEELLQDLDTQYRLVLELRYMAEKSYAEIAEITGVPIGTVKTYIYRAKAALKKKLTCPAGDGQRKGCKAR